MATISDSELARLKKSAAAYERRREQQRKDQAARTKRRRDAGFQRITIEIRAETYAKHRAEGMVPVGLVWIPATERERLLKLTEKNVLYKAETNEWTLEDA